MSATADHRPAGADFDAPGDPRATIRSGLAPSWRTLIISRRWGVSSEATRLRISAWLRLPARRNSLSFMPLRVPPGSTKGASCGSRVSALRCLRLMISSVWPQVRELRKSNA
jgi:hypothetical protein